MISFSQGARIVVAAKPVDFRRGGESLASLAREVLKEDPYKGVIVIFRSRRADRIKVVTWDKSGLVLAAARARGRKGGRQFELTKNQIRLAQSAMANRETYVADLCAELKISRATLYRYVSPAGELRDHGRRVLNA
jgi:transposase